MSNIHPPGRKRGVCDPKNHFKLFKLFPSKCYGEDIRNFVTFKIMSQMSSLGLYMLSSQMMSCVVVFSLIMEYRILSNWITKVLTTTK